MSTDFPTERMALTHLLVVGNLERSHAFYRDVLGAEVYREYGGTSVVLRFLGTWLLLVTGGEPTQDKPDVTFAAPVDPGTVSHSMTVRVPDCQAAYATLRARGAKFLTHRWATTGRCAPSSAIPTGTCWRSARRELLDDRRVA
jgi:predicted enzyme related to lactoylglutathione lyase